MSTYLISALEIKKDDGWKQVNTEPNSILHWNSNSEFIDLMVNSEKNYGHIDADLGMPEDVSPAIKMVYEDGYAKNASKPTYYTLRDLMLVYSKLYEEFGETLERRMKANELDSIKKRLDIIGSHIDCPRIQKEYLKLKKDEENDFDINRPSLEDLMERLLCVHKEITRIRTLAIAQGTILPDNIRVVWFIY